MMTTRRYGKRLLICAVVCLLMASLFAVTAYAAGTGDVAGAIQNTWDSAKTQIKSVVTSFFP